jgi:hypothetical protein
MSGRFRRSTGNGVFRPMAFAPNVAAGRKELFYMAPDQTLMATPVVADAAFSAGIPKPLFQVRTIPVPPTQPRRQYAVGSAGDRFLVNTIVEPLVPTSVTVALNWPEAMSTR